jgi:phosphopantetheinyl transferase
MEIAFSRPEDFHTHIWFSQEEQAELKTLSLHKQQSSALGRIAAKRAAQQYHLRSRGKTWPCTALGVRKQVSGKPMLAVEGKIDATVCLALSHSGALALAGVEACEKGSLGVDIEQVRDFGVSEIQAFLNASEWENYQAIPPAEQSRFATVRWCLKEAGLKAWGTGLREHPKNLSVRETLSGNYQLYRFGKLWGEGWEYPVPENVTAWDRYVAVAVHLLA